MLQCILCCFSGVISDSNKPNAVGNRHAGSINPLTPLWERKQKAKTQKIVEGNGIQTIGGYLAMVDGEASAGSAKKTFTKLGQKVHDAHTGNGRRTGLTE